MTILTRLVSRPSNLTRNFTNPVCFFFSSTMHTVCTIGTEVLRHRRHFGHAHQNHVSFEQQQPRFSQLSNESKQHSLDSGDIISDHQGNFVQMHHLQAPPSGISPTFDCSSLLSPDIYSGSSMGSPSFVGPSSSSPSTSDQEAILLRSQPPPSNASQPPFQQTMPSSSSTVLYNPAEKYRRLETGRGEDAQISAHYTSSSSSQPHASPAMTRLLQQTPNHVGPSSSHSGSRMSLSDDHFDQVLVS